MQNSMIPENKIQHFYKFHSRIYDWTRWSILFGRNYLIHSCPNSKNSHKIIVELGCGTGKNILTLKKKYPESSIYGFEISPDMAKMAKKKTRLLQDVFIIESAFNKELIPTKADLVIISYVLSMNEEKFQNIIEEVISSLQDYGILAIVDFDKSSSKVIRAAYRQVLVTMDGRISQYLKNTSLKHKIIEKSAYLGLWTYFNFWGVKEPTRIHQKNSFA